MIFGKNKKGNQYKFRSLKTYAWDRAYGSKRKYRTVFEKSELNYLSVELSVFNKLFDEEDWKTTIKLVATRKGSKNSTVICEKEETVTIPKNRNTFEYTFGWGNDEKGSFWEKGKYQWDAYIDGEHISGTSFYVEEVGLVTPHNNPYMTVLSLRTYEAPAGDLEMEEREYLKKFNIETTRYIMGELRFLNKHPDDWPCELFFHYYDDTGMLIGTSDVFTNIITESEAGKEYTLTAGWGSPEPGSWIEENYTLEVVFMDTVIAVIPFSTGKKNKERISEFEALLNEDVLSVYNETVEIREKNVEPVENREEIVDKNEETVNEPEAEKTDDDAESANMIIDDRPLNEIMDELNSLVGLEKIKNKIKEYITYVSFLDYRKQSGIVDEEKVQLHSIFTGNPGTGKTTVVKLLGMIFRSMGLLSKGHVYSVEANDLISGYIRQTGKETKKAIQKARGGILFIDEAYMLYKKEAGNDFGPEAVAALITEMSDGKGDIAIMVAGYPGEMKDFIESNPGLKSRFRNHYHFEDYTPEELVRIAEFAAEKKGVSLSAEAIIRLKSIIVNAYRKRDRTFGNARFVNALIDEAKINLGIRVMQQLEKGKVTKKELVTIKETDIEDVSVESDKKKLDLQIDETLLKEALDELNGLTGLSDIKQEVNELVKLSRYYKENNRDILKAFSMHSVFMGNPGTGKTTVARIIAKVYKALGLLERGHLIDADGSDLIAGYIGQTALKTKEIINKAMGGILFIDEAYAITEGRNTDFGSKAIAALIKEMEDHRSEFGLIVAGYTQNMQHFLKSNPGLDSRFDQKFHFKDFNKAELWQIAQNMFENKGYKVSKEARDHLQAYIVFIHSNRDQFFGNARSIRKIVERAVRNHELRMADITPDQRTPKMESLVTLADVERFVPGKKDKSAGKSLGFRIGNLNRDEAR